ncbi:hypothetical protein ERO13_D06G135100v2 [Gossypium hirsutum]|uniref:Uncharacterized protein n=3 Tax=Gossypium TaxID=3633 RepID=A0A5J5R423_GOSBA|nr:uncharacterized protein LOC107941192 isoform X1 [Gossypium hirsutum]KAB2025553.1 hypothetical protein ES319_D06G157800v1 [Gossypium barbadense]KAB2025559.1 hypothetical protein ES319_D06G157800v1 [Gossypium barbadense]KAG4142535.1 hypothetical protein ERO13_D06G135100v2 [Gossypium hirsutum]TYG65222.1 hypothetical protein ES288_D06G168800v1 [Gossypium darwinii]
MAFTHSLSRPFSIQFPSHSPQKFTSFPKLPFRNPKIPFLILSRSSPKPAPSTEQEALKFIADSDGTTLPCVRTYENDLARLTLVGAVSFDQALTAAAADGGRAATEHVDSGIPAMVIETVFPGPTAKSATVSTRLFLPARKVKEKAQKLKKSFSEDIFSGTSSKNILAMTFRQVVMQKIWSFELILFRPGTERDMEDLENPREQVPASFTLRSSEERVISVLGEVVCISALQSTEKHFLENLLGKTPSNFFRWFRKSKGIVSKDSSVFLHKVFEDEIVENARNLLESFNSSKESFNATDLRQKNYWWTHPLQSKLEKNGGHEFSAWTSEYIPAYRLEIDANTLKNVKFEGWRESNGSRWQVLLTHSQMVGLADILDMYYEDDYTLPKKQLHSGMVASYNSLTKAKRNSSFLKVISSIIASGILLITISTISLFSFPYLGRGGKYLGKSRSPSSIIKSTTIQSVDAEKLETFCVLVIQKIKDAFGWPGEIATETNIGAWIGEIPSCLKAPHQANSNSEDNSTSFADVKKIDADIKSSVQDIASYQVVLSTEGKIIGFQPTSRVGVNHWAVNPLTKELYGGKKLSPGLIEPRLKIQLPNEIVVLELLMSVNPDSCFALARPIQ